MEINPKEAISKTASFAQEKASDVAGLALATAKKAHAATSDIAKHASKAFDEEKERVREAYYKPIFPEEFRSPDYDRPKMIVIEDEDERKGIDVCEGAIGWFGTAAGLEVLHLYEEVVPTSGVEFFPRPECGAAYFENKITPGRYINLDCYYDVLEKDMFTELRRIAYELGAKKCTLESYEESKSALSAEAGFGGKFKNPADKKKQSRKIVTNNDSSQAMIDYSGTHEKSIVFTQVFEGSANPKRPELLWFKNDKEIEFLINTRCNADDANQTKTYRIQLDSSSTQTMSVSLAAKLDKAIGKLGCACNFSLEGKAKTEARKKFLFDVEF